MKRILEAIGAAAFAVALGIVGAVERGADVKMMWWTIPLIAVTAVAVLITRKERSK